MWVTCTAKAINIYCFCGVRYYRTYIIFIAVQTAEKGYFMKNTNTTLEQMVNNANAIENAMYTAIPTEVVEKLQEENNAIFTNECYRLATLEKSDFINAFFNVKLVSGISEKEIEKAVKTAVSVKVFDLSINDNGLIEISTTEKPIFFKDVFNARCSYHANAHTDKKPKEDKQKAIKHFFGDLGVGYCDLLTHSAYLFTNIDDIKFKPNANYTKTYNKVTEICEKSKKANPFEKDTNSGYNEQLAMIVSYFIGENSAKVTAYHAKAIFQMICNRNKFGKLTIADTNAVMNAFAIVYRYAFNGYKLPTNDKSTIYKVIKNNNQ